MALEHFYLKHSNPWTRDKKHSKAMKTARGTSKMKKATCGQFRVYERNFTCTVVTSPWPNALAAPSCERSAQPFPLRPMWPRTRRTALRLLDEQSPTTWTQTKVVCGTQEAKRSRISDALITLGPRGCLPLVPPAAPAGAPWGRILDPGSRCFFSL